jgi:hypothetical protein
LSKGEKQMGFSDDKKKESGQTKPLEDQKLEQTVDRQGQRERAKKDLVTGAKPEGRSPGHQRD